MLDLQGLTFAQKMHALKWGISKKDADPDKYQDMTDLEHFMQRFEANVRAGLTVKDAHAEVEALHKRQTGRNRYKDYSVFLNARRNYYIKRHGGGMPDLFKFRPTDSAYADGPYWQAVTAALEVGESRVKAWKAAERVNRANTGRGRYSTYQSFCVGYYNHRQHMTNDRDHD